MSQLERLREEIEHRYRERTPGSARLHAAACEVMPGGDTRNSVFLRPYPLYIREGGGAFVTDEDGHRYLDCTTNMSSVIHGHAHPTIVEAVTKQVTGGTGWAAANRWAPELAGLLCERVPGVELPPGETAVKVWNWWRRGRIELPVQRASNTDLYERSRQEKSRRRPPGDPRQAGQSQ